jgi:hypothetical protein
LYTCAHTGLAGGAVIANDAAHDVVTSVQEKVKAERKRQWLEKERARIAKKSAAFAAARYVHTTNKHARNDTIVAYCVLKVYVYISIYIYIYKC